MYCYVGGKGSGKTYSVVQNIIIPAFTAGIPIVTNIPLNLALIRKDFIHADVSVIDTMTIDNIIDTPPGVILIIDEIQLIVGASITYTKIDDALLEFFSKSRHKVDKGRATNIVVISQTLDGIGKPIKSLIDVLYKCRKLSVVGLSNRYQVKQFEMSGGAIVNKKPTLVANGKYLKSVYKYYNSNSQNVTTTDVVQVQEKLVKEKTIFNNRFIQFVFVFPIMFALLYYFYFSDNLFMNSFVTNTDDNAVIVESTTVSNDNDASATKNTVNDAIPPIDKYALINKLYGDPVIHLNGMVLNDETYFSLKSIVNDIYIASISLSKLRKMGFVVERFTSELYFVNDEMVSHKNIEPKKRLLPTFNFLPSNSDSKK